ATGEQAHEAMLRGGGARGSRPVPGPQPGRGGSRGHRDYPLDRQGRHAASRRRDTRHRRRPGPAGRAAPSADGRARRGGVDAVKTAQPEVIVHQMTALASMSSFRNFDKEFAVTNELRTRGTDYLLEAAQQAGARARVSM